MQFKDFIDISTKAGCKIGSKTDFRNNSTYYTVEYNGVKCKARFNPFVCMLYADDKYEIIKEK